MTKFSNKLEKPCYWPILGEKNFFSENPALSCTTTYEFLAPCQISEKKCLENAWTEGRMEGQRDGQTLFYRTFLATPWVQKLTDMKTYRWTQKQRKKMKKPTLSLVNAGPPDTEYLYYPLNVEGATQKASLLPAYIR